MVLWWIFFLVFVSIGFARQQQNKCDIKKAQFPAPVFGLGDNLSVEGCGIWDTRKKNAPWHVFIRDKSSGRGCYGILISPTAVLVAPKIGIGTTCLAMDQLYECPISAADFSYEHGDYNAVLGKCTGSNDYVKCVESGEGQIVEVHEITQPNAPGYPFPFQIWKIERATLKENYITPICLFNKGSLPDVNSTQQYMSYNDEWNTRDLISAHLFEVFSPCLSSRRGNAFQRRRAQLQAEACKNAHENFLCARLSGDDEWRPYLTIQEENRHFLRALQVSRDDQFYQFYELVPLLDQVASASGIPLMPNITDVSTNRTVFDAEENLSTDRCGTWIKWRTEYAPWCAYIQNPSGYRGCDGTLISPTSILAAGCESKAEEFEKSENKDGFVVRLGECAHSTISYSCSNYGEGQIVKIQNVTQLDAPGYPKPLHIWKIEKPRLQHNYIWPICIFNKGNQQDFNTTQQLTAYHNKWDRNYKSSADLMEDFGSCLSQSRNFKTLDKVHENFLCTRLSEKGWQRPYLTHEGEEDRYFLRALAVEESFKDRFYYEIVPLLDQIVSLSGDIPLMQNNTRSNM